MKNFFLTEVPPVQFLHQPPLLKTFFLSDHGVQNANKESGVRTVLMLYYTYLFSVISRQLLNLLKLIYHTLHVILKRLQSFSRFYSVRSFKICMFISSIIFSTSSATCQILRNYVKVSGEYPKCVIVHVISE